MVKGNTPQSNVDTALATRDSAAASVERTQAIIAQKEIKAPFAGRLGLRNVDLGQYVAVGTSLVTLQQLDPIYADFPVPEGALSTLATGQEARMTVDAIPGRTFTGKIQAIDARVSAESRNVTARAVFANSDRKLLPGMFANLTVTTGQSGDVLTLPRTAIVYSLYGDNVFVVTPAPQGAPQRPRRRGASGRQRPRKRPHRRAPLRAPRRRARREGRDRRGREGGRAGGDRGSDQAAGQYASHNRRERRATAASGNAETVTARR